MKLPRRSLARVGRRRRRKRRWQRGRRLETIGRRRRRASKNAAPRPCKESVHGNRRPHHAVGKLEALTRRSTGGDEHARSKPRNMKPGRRARRGAVRSVLRSARPAPVLAGRGHRLADQHCDDAGTTSVVKPTLSRPRRTVISRRWPPLRGLAHRNGLRPARAATSRRDPHGEAKAFSERPRSIQPPLRYRRLLPRVRLDQRACRRRQRIGERGSGKPDATALPA